MHKNLGKADLQQENTKKTKNTLAKFKKLMYNKNVK